MTALMSSTIKSQTMRSLAYYVTLLLLAFTSEATFAADADHGSILAKRWCASCHVVSSSQSVVIDHSPSFASIAQNADFTAEKLAFFLLEPHPKMPNMSLSRKEADDLAAYIAEQRHWEPMILLLTSQGAFGLIPWERHQKSADLFLWGANEHNPDPEMRTYRDPISAELRETLIAGAAAGTMQICQIQAQNVIKLRE